MATEYLLPVADGHYSDFDIGAGAGDKWEQIDDPVGNPDDNITHLEWTTVGNGQQSVVVANFTPGGTINSVTVHCRVYMANSVTSSATIFLRVNGTDYDGTSTSLTPSIYQNLSNTWETNPDTGDAWTPDDVNSLEAGCTLNKTGAATMRLTQMYISVDYKPGQPGQPWPVNTRIGTTIANMEPVLIEPHVEFMPGVRTDRSISKQDRWVGAPRCRWTYPDHQLTGEQYYQLAKQLNGAPSVTVYIDIPTQTLDLVTYTPIIASYRAIMHWPLEEIKLGQYNRWELPDDGILFTHLESI